MDVFSRNETVSAKLRELYERHGYTRFRMGKFEQYDLYQEYRNFLQTDHIITFNGPDGRLMALKPDITLSIAKSTKDGEGRKVYYHESVYRVPGGSEEYKEIPQIGLESIGNLDAFSLCEVLVLAEKSLATLSDGETRMDISHMGFVTELIAASGLGVADSERALAYIGKKNAHDLAALCDSAGVDADKKERLLGLIFLCGPLEDTLPAVKKLVCTPGGEAALRELEEIARVLSSCWLCGAVNLDFSIVNDRTYYNGVVFQGYLKGIPQAVLSGGRYDPLLQKLGKKSGAIGFAVYLNLLELYGKRASGCGVDALLLYGEKDDPVDVMKACEMLAAQGKRVRAEREKIPGLVAAKCYRLCGGKVCEE